MNARSKGTYILEHQLEFKLSLGRQTHEEAHDIRSKTVEISVKVLVYPMLGFPFDYEADVTWTTHCGSECIKSVGYVQY